METTTTAAEKFCEIASWLRRQNDEFTKNFKSMKSILRFWKSVPEDCKDRKIQPWLAKSKNKYVNDRLMLAVNAEFGFRYFEEAPKRYEVVVYYHEWRYRERTHMEVSLSRYDRYSVDRWGTVSVEIKDKTQARSAAEQLLRNNTETVKHDMDVTYSKELEKLMKKSVPTDEEFQEMFNIPGL